ncbi:unannotated protein [freshwater metagenome]|uniref:Unannotated protein n=1 Tax=freshwater metagenome TaxID=449393 RepID=A0A6J6M6E5_9ZZZZ
MPKTLPLLSDTAPICCAPLGATTSLTRDNAIALAVRLKALADPARLQLLSFLLDQPGQEACTCDLAPVLDLSEPTVNHHLKKMEAAGLLTRERRGMNVHYRVVPEAIHAVAEALHVRCC